jgi:hypothetical protein
MSKEILIATVSSLVTALVVFTVSQFLGLYTIHIERTQVPEIASAFINNDNNLDALLDAMEKHGGFVGPKGQEGPEGPRGSQGPAWAPNGALVLYARDVPCPQGSQQLSDFNIQTYRPSKYHAKSVQASTGDSTWDVNEKNWDGRTYRVCLY